MLTMNSTTLETKNPGSVCSLSVEQTTAIVTNINAYLFLLLSAVNGRNFCFSGMFLKQLYLKVFDV